VMIKAALRELERGGDIVHGSGVVSALLKKASGGAQDFLAGFLSRFGGGFAKYHPEMVSRNGVCALQAAEKVVEGANSLPALKRGHIFSDLRHELRRLRKNSFCRPNAPSGIDLDGRGRPSLHQQNRCATQKQARKGTAEIRG
jgi:hypothetical protein